MARAYRSWKRQYRDNWEARFRERFESDMIEKYDTHFFVGTVHKHPKNWIVVGLFYPPKRTTGDLRMTRPPTRAVFSLAFLRAFPDGLQSHSRGRSRIRKLQFTGVE